jgi:nucleoside-diphosphate kinase
MARRCGPLALFLIKPHVPPCLYVGMLDRLLLLMDAHRCHVHLKASQLVLPSSKTLAEHLAPIRDQPFYAEVFSAMASGPSYACVIEAPEARPEAFYPTLVAVTGPTNPEAASLGTIRGMYGQDATRNACHRSASESEAAQDIRRWIPAAARDLGLMEDQGAFLTDLVTDE